MEQDNSSNQAEGTSTDWGGAEFLPKESTEVRKQDLSTEDWLKIQNANTDVKLRTQNIETDIRLRVEMVSNLTKLFMRLNAWLFVGIAALAITETYLIYCKALTPADRVISSQVIMSLIAATAAQLGVGVAVMLAYLFPKRAGAEPPSA